MGIANENTVTKRVHFRWPYLGALVASLGLGGLSTAIADEKISSMVNNQAALEHLIGLNPRWNKLSTTQKAQIRSSFFHQEWKPLDTQCLISTSDALAVRKCAESLIVNAGTKILLGEGTVDWALGAPRKAWADIVTKSPFETDPNKLCQEISDPDSEQPRMQMEFVSLLGCREKIKEDAFEFQTVARNASGSAILADDVEICLAAVESWPYVATSINPSSICEPWSQYAKANDLLVRSGQHSGPTLARLQAEAQANADRLKRCLQIATSAQSNARAVREKNVHQVALEALLAIPPQDRLPQERARIESELQACRGEATKRRSDRESAVVKLGLWQLLAIGKGFRLPQESERIAQLREEHAALLESRGSDPKWVAPVLSALSCVEESKKRSAIKEIKDEQSYAKRYGGMVSMTKIYGLQEEIREADKSLAGIKSTLKRTKAKNLGCKNRLVQSIVGCLEGNDAVPLTCSSAPLSDYLDLLTGDSQEE